MVERHPDPMSLLSESVERPRHANVALDMRMVMRSLPAGDALGTQCGVSFQINARMLSGVVLTDLQSLLNCL